MTKRKVITLIAAVGVAAAAVVFGAAAAHPAQARPNYAPTCNASGCHATTPVGSVEAVPSKTTLTPGEAYTVAVTVGLSSSGQSGYHISSGAAGTPALDVTGGPGTSPFTANMTAPSAAGTYTYLVWGAKGTPGSGGQSTSTTYQITVASVSPSPTPPPGGDTTAPTVLAPSKSTVKKGKVATIKYQINDAEATDTGSATIVIKNKAGKAVKTLKPGSVACNSLQQTTFKCKLAKGKYTFTVTAVDAAGNASSNAATNKLVVK